ncbi:MAG: AAA family ATPase [Candidatus Riflebacteria bacterium]|nr:AAA family ATPase [Candidatus Riflebacteria bacterium]
MLEQQSRDLVREGIEFFKKVPLLSPREIVGRLEKLGYRGQEEARRVVALMAYRHVKRLKKIYVEGLPRGLLPQKSNYLLMGPTGCGKTYLIELLFQNILKIPTVIIDITGFSETGDVGDDTKTILTRLLMVAQNNPVIASGGIVCLDEFDKLASTQNNARFDGQGTTKDVSGFGVQKELLRMMEASEVYVPLDFNNTIYSPKQGLYTGDISFLACGAFSGFKLTASRRGREQKIGFAKRVVERRRDHIAAAFEETEISDIENFQAHGFLPELIGRFTRIVALAPLDRPTLRQILVDNVVEKFQREFDEEGLSLKVDDTVLDHIVEQAFKRQTGARGLVSVLTRHLEECAYEVFCERRGNVTLKVEGGKVRWEVR